MLTLILVLVAVAAAGNFALGWLCGRGTETAAAHQPAAVLPLASSYDLTAAVEHDLGCRIFDCKDQDRIAAAIESWRKRLCMFPGDVVVGDRDIVSDRVIFHRLDPVVAEMIRAVVEVR